MVDENPHGYAVIMAGGKGTRFWPESTAERPKQLLDLLDTGKSLLRVSFERAARLVPVDNVLVVTGEVIAQQVREELPELPSNNVLVEPVGRNTAPCVGWAAVHIRATDPSGVMAVLPADHHIEDEEGFLSRMRMAMGRAAEAGTVVTIGIRPSRAETGYGYIEGGDVVTGEIRKARRFVEKPDRATAERYLDAGNYYWNAGIFNFTVERILFDTSRFMPELHEGLTRIEKAAREGDAVEEAALVGELYGKIAGESIDYGIMEKEPPGDIEVIPSAFGWSDLGSWGALYERLPHDERGNARRGVVKSALEDVEGCLLSTTSTGKVIAAVGVRDLVVIDTDDAVLVCPRDRDQDVKKLSELLKKG
jgi:mannose-1-phosphate guanylyltransferase